MEDGVKYGLIAKINQAFTPGAPIDSRDLFAGRKREVEKLISTVFQRGQHAVLFGERGVGKTSLANTLFDFLVLMGKFNYQRARINCADGMDFEAIWRLIFRQLTTKIDGEDVELDNTLPGNPNSENVREVFQAMDDPSIIIIDELDRISSQATQTTLADTVKTLSDNSIKTTLIMVGVADSLDQLIAEHRSIERAIKQIPMPRMSKAELIEIVDKGLGHCPELSINPAVKDRIADYSQGLPSYTHLLTREAALKIVRESRTYVIMPDLEYAIKESVDSQLETTLTAYNNAVSSPRGTNYKPVLLSCALAQKDEHGYFYAKNVTGPLRLITTKSYKIPAFARHLKDFCDASRGPVLERRGKPKRIRYRFVKPLMEPYVVLRGLADGLITEQQLNHPSASSTEPEQLSLLSPSSVPEIEI
jgi:hypothetical protein